MANLTFMYRCEICQKVIPPHTKAVRLPYETRTRQYPSRQKEVSAGRGRRKTVTIPGGIGFEIVREVVACPDCAAEFERNNAATVSTA